MRPQGRAAGLAGRSTVYAPHGVLATSQPLATAAGLRVLQDGGNAVDAAVTAAAVLSVVEPHMTGMGGDLFALMWIQDRGRVVGLDASGRAGSLMTPERLRADGHAAVPASGAGSVTVPGALAGWSALLESHGTLSLAAALAPAIDLAEHGFPVTPVIARQWGAAAAKLAADAGARTTFLLDGERAPRAGEWFTNSDLARSLRSVADGGSAVLYGGALGRALADGVRALGGYLTTDDLAAYRADWVDPISIAYKGNTVWEIPPAGQGVAALQMLGMAERFDLAAMGWNSAAYLHTLVELKKLAFADVAAYVCDREAMEIPVAALLDAGYLADRAAELDPARAAERAEPGAPAVASETIYLAAADRQGNMVSFINSIYEHFGSGVVVPGTGFALQNRGAGFVLEEGHPNRVAPGKRPLHTIIPAFVTKDGAPWMAFGVMGGPMQPQGHVQVLLNLIEFGMDPQEAIDAARFRHLAGRRLAVERIDAETQARLEALGHELVDWTSTEFGGAQLVIKLERGWAAASDPRKDGMAAGH
ncbi:MAG: gamma-glutamyltransferase [Gemmatimonadetes bacterium]|nr:gamma-glutamyltransferase [Gemmatimonadota bacterium]